MSDDSSSGKGPVDRRGFFRLLSGQRRAGPPDGQREQPDRPVVRLLCGGWVEVRSDELREVGGLGELVSEFLGSDLGLVQLVAGPEARAGSALAAAGVGVALVPEQPSEAAASSLEQAGVVVLAPGSYEIRNLGDITVALIAGEVHDPVSLGQAVRAAREHADAAVAVLARTAWLGGPRRADQRAAEAAVVAGAAAVLVGPGAPWAGLERQGSTLVSYGLGALVPAPGVPAAGPSALLSVTLDRDGLHSFSTVPVQPALAGQSPRLLVGEAAEAARVELARVSRAVVGRHSAL